MVPLALETAPARKIRHPRGRQIAARHHTELGGDDIALIGPKGPAAGRGIEQGGGHAGVELDIAPQVEPVGNMVDIAQDLRLGAVALRPGPLLLQIVVEGIGIFQALDVAARAGIAVPEPGAADARTSLEHPHGKPQPAKPMQRVEPAQATADDRHIGTSVRACVAVVRTGSMTSDMPVGLDYVLAWVNRPDFGGRVKPHGGVRGRSEDPRLPPPGGVALHRSPGAVTNEPSPVRCQENGG